MKSNFIAEKGRNQKQAGIFDPEHRALTSGILLGVTLVAFEALAVVTVAPRFTAELGGTALYGWVFSALLLASLLGTVLGGQRADTRGPGRVVLAGLLLFGVGLCVSAAAPSMAVLILGRVLQGLGGGALVTGLYVVVNLAYADALRPAVMAAMSSAWVVPALVGPTVAGFLAQSVGWRVIFWGLLPLLALVAALTVPAFGRLPKRSPQGRPNRLPSALRLVAGTGLFLVGLSLTSVWGMVLLVVGAPLALHSLRALVPAGTLTFRPGLASLIASRGLFYAAFAGVEAFITFMLTRVHGYSEAVTGVAIATGALSWAFGSAMQARLDARTHGERRAQRIRLGTVIVTGGLAVQIAALFAPTLPLVISVLGWSAAGLGIGLAHATTSVLAFAQAEPGEEGTVSSALQLADTFSSALSTGVGGALLALATRAGLGERTGVLWAFAFSLSLVLLSTVAAGRVGRGGASVYARPR